MKLSQPVKPFIVVQKFGEQAACVDIATGTKTITCDGNNPPKGYKSLYGKGGHKGIDLVAKHGQPVYASHDGHVSFIDTNPKTGLDVKVEFEEDGEKWQYVNEHLLGYNVEIGEFVKEGQLLGWANNTGWSSGDHDHFELKKWDGKKWLSVDPMLYMENRFAKDVSPIGIKEDIAVALENLATSLRIPPHASVDYATALKNLQNAPLSADIRARAIEVLKKKYGQK